MSILLGTSAFATRGDAHRRERAALAAWRALRGVTLANLQWPDGRVEVEGFPTHAVLRLDSRTVSGREGPRKPVALELFDRLCALAEGAGCRWFGYANSDVRVTQAAVDRVAAGGREGYAFSRMDFDAQTGEDAGMVLGGIDLFVVEARWWRANRHRFRAYLIGEPTWDNVYAAVLLRHADAVLLNREALVRHERHPAGAWSGSPFARYLQLLAALDRPYFTRWAHYHDRLLELRARGAPEAEELALQRHWFRLRPSPAARAVQALRALKARVRYAVARG